MPPSPERIARFSADLDRLGGGSDGLGLAVSGGPDSLALLLLAAAARPAGIVAATVDHGLRPEAGDEARLVAALCAELGVRHVILQAEVDTGQASLQRAAREARYRRLGLWLSEQGIDRLATAHHADDQAETLIMRLLRGSGVAGLAGVRSRGPLPFSGSTATLIRPLLGWRRDELRKIVDEAGIVPVDDPSNRDARFDRVRVREALARNAWIEPAPLARSAAALAEADEALDWAARRVMAQQVTGTGAVRAFDARGVPAELRRRVLLKLLQSLVPGTADPRGEEVTRLLARLEEGATATLAGVKCAGGEIWRFEAAPPRKPTGSASS